MEGVLVPEVVQKQEDLFVIGNMTEGLIKILEKRCETLSSSEIESRKHTPQIVSAMVVEELVLLFNGEISREIKVHYRKIYYCLKEEKNNILFRKLLFGEILPYDIVRMTMYQMSTLEDNVQATEESKPLNLIRDNEKSSNQNSGEDNSVKRFDSDSEVRHCHSSMDSAQEPSSSTVDTPVLMDESVEEKEWGEPLFQRTLKVNPLVFKANFHCISHEAKNLKGTLFPEDPVTVEQQTKNELFVTYMERVKKAKCLETITFLLTPPTVADRADLLHFCEHLLSEGTFGMIGGLLQEIKDVYFIPLDTKDPLPQFLPPFNGPGLPKERTMQYILAVVNRRINIVNRKRQLSPSSGPKVGEEEEKQNAVSSSLTKRTGQIEVVTLVTKNQK